MRKIIFYFVLLLGFVLSSCESSAPSSDSTKEQPTTTVPTSTPIPTQPDCQIPGKVLDENKIWFPTKQLYAAIISDSTTTNEEYGDVYRILVLADKDCKLIFRKTLPENDAPDYGYFLAPINYNNNSRLVGIKGFDAAYVFDLDNKKLYPKLVPKFLTERFGEDAQSGQIIRIEVWENFLIGYAQDFGSFVFDLSDKEHPKAILPVAEYSKDDTNFSSLFALPSKDGMTQLIIPVFDFEKDEFEINPLLQKAADLNLNLSKSARNNKLIVLRQNDNQKTPLAINLEKKKLIPLPDDIKQKKTGEIIRWMKGIER